MKSLEITTSRWSTRDWSIQSVEALVRWESQKLGTIGTQTLIHMAEQYNLITQLDNYVLKTACKEILYAFPNDRPNTVNLSINISVSELFHDDFISKFINTVSDTGFSLSRITIEITESVMINDVNNAVVILSRLKELGCGVSIDDFGTGYSSLSYINNLPTTELKIDKSFIDKITEDEKSKDLIRSILVIGQIYNNKIIAEGVETKEQMEWLKSERCHIVQGYYFAKPMPISKLQSIKLNGLID